MADFDHLSRCGAIRILENDATLDDERLAAIYVRHRETPAGKALHEALDDVMVLDEGAAQHVGQRITGHVVVGWTETPGQDDDVGTVERAAEMLGNLAATITHDALRPELDPE